MLLRQSLDEVMEFAQATTLRAKYFNDFVAWSQDIAGVTLWSKQREISRQVQRDRNVAVKAGHGVGKSFWVALLICWWVDTRYPNAFVVSTAPSQAQISAIVWREIRLLQKIIDKRFKDGVIGHKLPGYITSDNEWKDDSGTLIGFGRRPPEKDVGDMIQGIHCLTPDHEVLTRRGWVPILTAREGEDVLTVSEDGDTVWTPVQKVHRYDYDGPLEVFEGKGLSFKATPNHRFFAQRQTGRWTIEPYENLPKHFNVRTSGKWEGQQIEVPPAFSDLGFTPKSFAKFLGHWAGDGGLRKNNKNNKIYEVLIYGTKNDPAKYFPKGIRLSRGKDYVGISNVEVASWLEENVGRYSLDRRVPDIIQDAPKDIIREFVEGFWEAEGSGHTAYSASEKLAGGVQHLLLKLGHLSSVGVNRPAGAEVTLPKGKKYTTVRPTYTISRSSTVKEHRVFQKRWASTEHYQGEIGCLTTGEGTFYVRHRGRAHVTGNSQYVLAVGDEAVGLSQEMIAALGNITSNEYSRRVLIANPTNPYCYFAEIFEEGTKASKTWTTNTISVLESPNYTDEKDEMPPEALAALTGTQYEKDMRDEYGEDSAQYRSRVLGEFDRDSDEPYLIREEDIAEAEDTDLEVRDDAVEVLGVDVARFGKDFSVIYSNKGGRLRYVDHLAHQSRTTEVASWVHRVAMDRKVDEVRIDGLGVGGGVVDLLLTFPDRKYRIVSLNASGTSPDPRRWYNMRAYWWDNFKSNMQQGLIDLDVEDKEYRTLKSELLEVRYKINPQSGSIIIESKEDMRKRGVKSPDFGDAAVFAGMSDHEYSVENPVKKEISYQDPSEMLELTEYNEDYYLDLMRTGGY